MPRMLERHALRLTLAILGGFLAAGDLAAQDPKPTPLPTTRPIPIQTPERIDKQPRPEGPAIGPRVGDLPDLRLSLSPQSLNAAPQRFTVENSGAAAITRASLLRVTIRLLPLPEGQLVSSDESPFALDPLGGLRTSRDVSPGDVTGRSTRRDIEDICSPPLVDFEAAIDPLEPGETQVVTQSGTRAPGGVRHVGLVATTPATRIPTHSYIRQIEVRVVCVYELRATVDANRDVSEWNEGNNEIVHTFQREVTLR